MSEDAADRILTFDDMAGMIKELSINDSIKRLLLKHNNALRSSQEKMIDYRERCIKAESERDALREEISRLPSRWQEDSSLKTWFPLSAEILERLESENSKLREELRNAMEQEPAIRVIDGKIVDFNPNYNGDLDGDFYASPVPAQKENIWLSALIESANALISAYENNSGNEPSASCYFRAYENFRSISSDYPKYIGLNHD